MRFHDFEVTDYAGKLTGTGTENSAYFTAMEVLRRPWILSLAPITVGFDE
jgi:hypothetical protein